MSVIVELQVAARQFELGRILDVHGGTTVTLETMVPMGEKAVPFFSVYEESRGTFEKQVQENTSVESIQEIATNDDRTMYALDWAVGNDEFFKAVAEGDGHLLSGTGTATNWQFEIQFPTHDRLSTFRDQCETHDIKLEVTRIYNPTKPSAGPWFGLSNPQRETLFRAVEGGYYAIPREISTQDLADEFDVSDQAVTERLRRAIATLVDNTLVAAREETEESHQTVD